MRFSVIVPVYNVEAYLSQCVDSILAQSFPDYEVILVDDGSSDGSPQLCDQYAGKDSRVKVIHQKNGGLSDARNSGIRAAAGDFLLFIDSDDYWNSPLVLEKINAVLQAYPAELVQYGQERLYAGRSETEPEPRGKMSENNGLAAEDMLRRLVAKGELTISACLMAASRTFIVENDLYFKKGIKTEDLEWAIRAYLCKPRWAFLDECFYVYRIGREGSITSTIGYQHLCDYCWILEQSVLRVEAGEESIREALMSYLMYHVLIASALVSRLRCSGKKKREVLSRLRSVSKGRVLRYNMDRKVKLAGHIYRIGGFYPMAKILGVYLRNRRR